MPKTVNSLVLFNTKIGPLSGATTPGQNGPGGNVTEGYSAFPKALALLEPQHHCLALYLGRSFGRGSCPSEKQSVYSTTTADWAW